MAEEHEYYSYTDFTIKLTVSQPAANIDAEVGSGEVTDIDVTLSQPRLNVNYQDITEISETILITFGRWFKGEKGDKGDDADVYTITITESYSNDAYSYTCDRTAEEIYENIITKDRKPLFYMIRINSHGKKVLLGHQQSYGRTGNYVARLYHIKYDSSIQKTVKDTFTFRSDHYTRNPSADHVSINFESAFEFAEQSDIPTLTSQLTNDSGFITSSGIPAQVQSDWNEPDNTDPAYIANKPTFGTAAALDVAASGNASATQVVKGDDTRLAAEILWCSWDNTNNTVTSLTVQQIVDAKTNHKVVCCKDDNMIFICTHASSSYIVFSCVNSTVSASSDTTYLGYMRNDYIVYSPYSQKWAKDYRIIQRELIGSGTGQNIKTVNGNNLLGSGDVHISGDIMFLTATAVSNNTYKLPKTPQELINLYGNGITVVVAVGGYLFYRGCNSNPDFFNIKSNNTLRRFYYLVNDEDGVNTIWRVGTYNIQEQLISGTNIKTINNESILGSGDITITASGINAIPLSEKGANGGVAELDSNGKVPSSQLPSYVDDVLEYASQSAFPTTGESGKIYIAQDTNKTYRWSGSAYVEISASLALGETSSTAYRGDRGKTAYDHSQVTDGSNPHNTTFANIANKPTTISGYGITDAFSGDYNDLTNKPTIPTIRTINHEQIADSTLGDINIHDGFYFPNAVQDYDGNWYGAVIIGNQVWLGENLRTTHYIDGTSIPEYYHANNDNSNDNVYGLLYPKNSVIEQNGNSYITKNILFDNRFHIPSENDWMKMLNYLRNQNRFCTTRDNIFHYVAKSLASTSGWDSSSGARTVGNQQNLNNKTSFNAFPAGEYDPVNQQYKYYGQHASFLCTTVYNIRWLAYFSEAVYRSGNDEYNVFSYSIRCLCDLTPEQFRDWYINQYGSLQHHLPQEIPTVNNAALTISQGSTTLGIFTANQATNVSVAIPQHTFIEYTNS